MVKTENFRNIVWRRQADFRKTSSTVSEQGRCPSDDLGRRHGHLLALGCEDENLYPSLRGASGVRSFFKQRGLKWHRRKSGDTPGEEGPTRNMASSQVACVNFLLPLSKISGALAAALRTIDSDVKDIVAIRHDGRMSPVEFEWIGLERSLEGGTTRGANNTSADALLLADTEAGRRAYVIEWKYAERGSNKYLGRGKSGNTRRRRYTDYYLANSSAFRRVVPMDELLYDPFYQLMRLRLLADRMTMLQELEVSEAKVVAVVPKRNLAYREKITSHPLAVRFPHCRTVAEVMKATLKHPDQAFALVCPSQLLKAVRAGMRSGCITLGLISTGTLRVTIRVSRDRRPCTYGKGENIRLALKRRGRPRGRFRDMRRGR